MKLLLTGGSGYIGSHTALCLLANTDSSITILDNLSTGFIQNYEYLASLYQGRVSFVKADLCDTQSVDKILASEKFDAVLHFGASLIVSESVQKPLLYYKNNVINTTNLIDSCVRHGVKNFIFSSTAAVYGEPDASLIPVNELTPLAPINPYGTSKMMSELVLRDVSAVEDFSYVALRYFNVAGASMANTRENLAKGAGLGQRSKNATHLIKVAVECATGKREKMAIYGDDYATEDGTCIRDYIHIDDLASAHLSVLNYLLAKQKDVGQKGAASQKEGQKSTIFNVGYNRGYSVKEVIECVKEVSGRDFIVEMAARRAGDPAILVAGNEKILTQTDWKPKYNDLKTIIKSAYDWECYLK